MKRMPGGWTAEMDAVLLEVFPAKGCGAVAQATGRSRASVQARAHRLGLRMNRRGTRPGGVALVDRLAAAIVAAGPRGLAPAELAELHPDDKAGSLRTELWRLVAEGRVFAAGNRQSRRLFACAQAALDYDVYVRPRTARERAAIERATRDAAAKRNPNPLPAAKPKARANAAAAYQVVHIESVPAPVTTTKARGPALVDGPVTYHPNFKITRGPSPPAVLRTNTHSKL
jgi:hypothetical protein